MTLKRFILRFISTHLTLSDGEDAELLVYLVDEEKDIYTKEKAAPIYTAYGSIYTAFGLGVRYTGQAFRPSCWDRWMTRRSKALAGASEAAETLMSLFVFYTAITADNLLKICFQSSPQYPKWPSSPSSHRANPSSGKLLGRAWTCLPNADH